MILTIGIIELGRGLWHGSRFSSLMAEKKSYTIYFTYDVNDHSLRFPLRAEVEGAGTGVYTITNIRQEGQHSGALLPPMQMHKEAGIWKMVDTKNTSVLGAAIGMAIDELEQSA